MVVYVRLPRAVKVCERAYDAQPSEATHALSDRGRVERFHFVSPVYGCCLEYTSARSGNSTLHRIHIAYHLWQICSTCSACADPWPICTVRYSLTSTALC